MVEEIYRYYGEVTDLKYDKEVNRIPLLEAEVKRSEADWFKGSL